MQTILDLHAELVEAVKNCNDKLRVYSTGQHGHQGDVYVHPIAKRPEVWDVLVNEHTQVALGNTMGSRHIATGNVRVYWPHSITKARENLPLKIFSNRGEAPLTDNELETVIGPIVEATEPWTLTHPEHAHCEFPAGTYFVTYQFDEAQRRAVRD